MSDHIILVIWVIKTFFYSSSVYSCHLLLISSASVSSLPFLSFIVPILTWIAPLVSLIFLKISLIFPILLFYSISLHCSLENIFFAFLPSLGTLHSNGYIFPFPLCLLFLLFSQLSVRPPQTTILPSCIHFIWDNFGHHLLYNLINLHPQFFRDLVYQI